MNNELKTKDIIEGITFILMVVGIIGLMCVLYEVNELKRLTKGASNFRSITTTK
jgi:TctA family transporter